LTQESVDWSSNVTLLPGPNVIIAQSISVQPSGVEYASGPVTNTIFYIAATPSPLVRSELTLQTSGSGRIIGQFDNASLEINKLYSVTALPIGNSIFANWSSGTNASSLSPIPGNATLAFLMTSNLIIQANFVTNYFTSVAGVYSGLFYQTNTNGVTEESAGFLAATLPASGHGAFSARLLLDGGSYHFTGMFNLSGDAEKTVIRHGKTPVTVDLHLNLAANKDQITGSVNDYSVDGWNSQLLADRAVFNARTNPATNYTGRYTLILPPGSNAPANEPGGYGYATLSNHPSGLVLLNGHLGDGTSISQSVPISKDGYIPLYVSLYSHQGLVLGWLALTNDPGQKVLGANLSWIKVSSPPGTPYAGGFTNTNIAALGSLYVPNADIPSLTNGTLTISNASMASPLTYSNLTIAGDKLVSPVGNLGVITPGTGVLTVTFQAAGANTDTVAKGVILQSSSPTKAAGYFSDSNQSGSFVLQQ